MAMNYLESQVSDRVIQAIADVFGPELQNEIPSPGFQQKLVGKIIEATNSAFAKDDERPKPLLQGSLPSFRRQRTDESHVVSKVDTERSENDDDDLPRKRQRTQDRSSDMSVRSPSSAQESVHSRPASANSEQPRPDIWRFGPIRKRNKKGPTAVVAHRNSIDTSKATSRAAQIEWYHAVNSRDKFKRGDVINLRRVIDIMQKVYDAHDKPSFNTDIHVLFNQLREQLHSLEFYPFLGSDVGARKTIKESRLLDPGGLMDIAHNPRDIFPPDIVHDAEALYRRWERGDFDPDIYRGIDTSKQTLTNGNKRTGYNVKKDYEFIRSANYIGAGELYNGQWWPCRAAAYRDGAHGVQEGGIWANNENKVMAVVIAQGGYRDEDRGDEVLYCGTEGTANGPSRMTELMLETANSPQEERQPIRLLRSTKHGSDWAPREGHRYDGLYTIEGYELVAQATHMYRFRMVRQPDQDPIRCKIYPEIERPTTEELKALETVKGYIKDGF